MTEEMAVLMAYSHLRSSGHLGASSGDELRKFVAKRPWQKEMIELSAELAKKNNRYYKEFMESQQ